MENLRSGLRLAAALLVALLTLPNSALATSFAERSFPDGVKDAPIIVHGKIGSSYADWAKSPDGARRIFTFYDLALDEVLKGSANSRSIVIRELGGQKDGIGLEVPGVAHFERGEDVVVFLSDRNPDGSYDVRGMMMGKYNLVHDQNDNKDYLMGAGLSMAPSDPDHPKIRDEHDGQSDTGSQKITMESLRQLIASQREAPSASPKPVQSPTLTPVATPARSASPAASPEAPQLQSPSPQQAEAVAPGGQTSRIWIVIGTLALLGAVIFLLTRK